MEHRIHPIFADSWPASSLSFDHEPPALQGGSFDGMLAQMRSEMDRIRYQMNHLMSARRMSTTTMGAPMPLSPPPSLSALPYHWNRQPVPYFGRSLSVQSFPETGLGEVKNDKDKFEVTLDVSQFVPEEISVKTVDNMLKIEAKHEDKPDEHGFITRHFVRRYHLPKDVDCMNVRSRLTPDGKLVIEAAKKSIDGVNERQIPIESVSQI